MVTFMRKHLIIGVAGGTGSGKTTFTDRLKNEFGNNITVLHHDNYYKSQSNFSTEERKNTNYDHPNQLETKLLIEHLQQLRMGKLIECPIYDFTQHTRSDKTCTIVSAPVILVEGILYRDPIIGHAKKRLYVAFIQSIFNIRKKGIVLLCPIKRT